MISDLLEGVALACLVAAAFVIFGLPGALIGAGGALLYFSRVYGGKPLPHVALPKLRLPSHGGS